MEQAIKIKIGGIKCDTEGCDFCDENAKFEDFPKWLDKPCPKCGANLLTRADLDAVIALLNAAEGFNRDYSVHKKYSTHVPDNGQRFRLAMCGNGTFKIEEMKNDKPAE